MATLRTNQLDINLSRVSDDATRSALDSIVRFVNEMTQGISVNKTVKASQISNQTGSAVIDADGALTATSLDLAKGGKFKAMVVSGTLSASASKTVNLPAGNVVLGVVGWTQVNTGSSYIPMPIGSASNAVYIVNSGVDQKTVSFTNSDINSANTFYAIIFYKKGR